MSDATIDDINQKLLIGSIILTGILIVLVAIVIVLLGGNWATCLGSGAIIGSSVAYGHNWVLSKLALRYNLDLAPSVVQRPRRPPLIDAEIVSEQPIQKRYNS